MKERRGELHGKRGLNAEVEGRRGDLGIGVGNFGHQVGVTKANIRLTKAWGLVSRHWPRVTKISRWVTIGGETSSEN